MQAGDTFVIETPGGGGYGIAEQSEEEAAAAQADLDALAKAAA